MGKLVMVFHYHSTIPYRGVDSRDILQGEVLGSTLAEEWHSFLPLVEMAHSGLAGVRQKDGVECNSHQSSL